MKYRAVSLVTQVGVASVFVAMSLPLLVTAGLPSDRGRSLEQ